MAPESSTQTDVERNAPSPSNPTFPSNAQHPAQTFAQQQQEQQQQPGFQQDPRSYGPPYAPYPQPAGTAATGANQQWAPPRVEEPKAWMITKLTLHGLNILSCVIGLGLTGALRSVQTLGLIALGACPIFVVAMIWSIAEILTRFGRKWKAGIHPGAHVAVSLLIWLGAAVVGGLESTLSSYYSSFDYLDEDCEYDPDVRRYVCTSSDKVSSKRALFVALSVFTCLVWLWHFILFVGACIDTQKRNAAMRKPVTMVFGGPGYWVPGAQGFQQMPQYYGPPQGQSIPMQHWAPPPTEGGNGKEPMTMAQPAAQRYA
ncbi:Ff.00g101830.m01.CDS01 [Fusarium sp. VM40]|nr:Ff.00g101830.m01.CDS01 [Fusarium sp. VM40]